MNEKSKQYFLNMDSFLLFLVFFLGGLSVVGWSIFFWMYQKFQTKDLQNHKLERLLTERSNELENQKLELQSKNEDITASINYARRIQTAILPDYQTIHQFLPDSFIFFRPRDIVSGDFYWFSAKNSKIIIAAVDCTGHGVPGAFMSLISNNLLNETVNQRGITDTGRILYALNSGIEYALKQRETFVQDGMDLSLCVIDEKRKYLEYSGARNPLLCIRDNELYQIDADRKSIGGQSHEIHVRFQKKSIELFPENPTCFYLFSDGFQDQFGGEKGKKFMKKRFKKLLFKNHQKTMPEQQNIVNQAFDNWKGTYDQVDDVLVIGFRL